MFHVSCFFKSWEGLVQRGFGLEVWVLLFDFFVGGRCLFGGFCYLLGVARRGRFAWEQT